MSLKPRHVLLVEAPGIFLQLLCRQTLLEGALLEIEHEEQCVHRQPLEDQVCLCLSPEEGGGGVAGVAVAVEVAGGVAGGGGLLEVQTLRGELHGELQHVQGCLGKWHKEVEMTIQGGGYRKFRSLWMR